MAFEPNLAAIRFGCGLSPVLAPPESVNSVLSALRGPDFIAKRFPVEGFDRFRHRLVAQREEGQKQRNARFKFERDKAQQEMQKLRRQAQIDSVGWYKHILLRRVWTSDAFRERLTAFWADHFTATGKGGAIMAAMAPYIEDAIRPNLAARFEDLLIATATHPVMLHYLDQDRSAGPNSALAQRRGQDTGLNENLAREVLELHTVGVGAGYDQTDVTELARLFAGLSFSAEDGFVYRAGMGEPGIKTVLGRRYGGGAAAMRDVIAVLRDLARHPATAAHIGTKLARHFVSDAPPADLVDDLSATFRATQGDLLAVYDTLLQHPASWSVDQPNVKQPLDLIGAAMRALAVPPDPLMALPPGRTVALLVHPMRLMGHDWGRPDGPDGLPEEDSAWITPQGLAARLQWAMAAPQVLQPDLPDPRDFVRAALGARASGAVEFAAQAAETRAEGVGIILASPSFQLN